MGLLSCEDVRWTKDGRVQERLAQFLKLCTKLFSVPPLIVILDLIGKLRQEKNSHASVYKLAVGSLPSTM